MKVYDLVDDIKNENEEPVIDMVHEYQMEDRLPCSCRECLLDITALALNALKPRYGVAFVRKIYTSEAENIKFTDEIKEAIDNACEIVKARPHHFEAELLRKDPLEIKIDGDKMEFN